MNEKHIIRLKQGLRNSEFSRLAAIGMLLAGENYVTIEKQTGLTRAAVFYLVRRIEEHGVLGLVDRRRGRLKKRDPRIKDRILELLVFLKRGSAGAIADELAKQDGTRLTASQVRRLLSGWGLRYRKTRFRERYCRGDVTDAGLLGSFYDGLDKTLDLS